jgi:hypothetical protein
MIENRLLAALPAETVCRLRRHMKTVNLLHGQVLHRPCQEITDVYFPLDCMISITVTTSEVRTAEAGAVGSREMVGINAFMGGRETNQTEYMTQIAGSAVVMPSKPLLDEFDSTKAVRDVLLRYTQAYIAHLSQNVACNGYTKLSSGWPGGSWSAGTGCGRTTWPSPTSSSARCSGSAGRG